MSTIIGFNNFDLVLFYIKVTIINLTNKSGWGSMNRRIKCFTKSYVQIQSIFKYYWSTKEFLFFLSFFPLYELQGRNLLHLTIFDQYLIKFSKQHWFIYYWMYLLLSANKFKFPLKIPIDLDSLLILFVSSYFIHTTIQVFLYTRSLHLKLRVRLSFLEQLKLRVSFF